MNDTLLIRGASAILTGLPGAAMRHDVARDGGDLRVRGTRIEAIGRLAPLPGERIIDAAGCVVQPGWVNTHHHLFQSLLKGVPEGIDLPLVPWLSAVPVPWRRHFDHEAVLRTAARVGLVELLLSGCTTVADHQYHYWPGMPFDASAAVFDEAARLGQRFVLCRGGQTRGREIDIDPPPQTAPETLDQMFSAIERDVDRYHDPAPDSMRRVVCAPTTPTWSVRPEELRPIARAARALGIGLHSHLSESLDYVRHCRELHDCTPFEFVERHEWVGPDVWFAHMVHLSPDEVRRVAETGTGTAHCPQSNGRLGSGVAPIPALLAAGAPVSLAVDGAASNEAADMLNEAHACWLMHRAIGGASAIGTDEVIRIGTAGGARVLGLDAVGTLAPGQAADLAVWSLDAPCFFGLHDPAAATVVSGGRPSLRALLIAGQLRVENDAIPGLDLAELRHEAATAVAAMREAQARR
jgi:cytosine/adenosine deaminase-related metal-dependent hydrolase